MAKPLECVQLAAAFGYRFSSKEWHENSGLVYSGFRFYGPELQRWLNRDPIGEAGGSNLQVTADFAPRCSIPGSLSGQGGTHNMGPFIVNFV